MTAFLTVSLATWAGPVSGQVETPEQYVARAGGFYETKYLPETVQQISKRVELTVAERDAVAEALRRHIYAFLNLKRTNSCFGKADWQQLFDRFDRSINERLPTEKASLVTEWRARPAPEGNALGFLFIPPWAMYASFERVVITKAQKNAVDCGFHEMSAPCNVEKCVLESVKAKKPFRALYRQRGIDSLVARAVVGLDDGTGIVLQWDSMGDRITERICEFEIGRSVHGGEHVDCK